MQNVMTRFWNDDEGALITVEWVFFVTIMVIGLVAGLKTLQGSVMNELEEVAGAIGAVSQSYSFGGTSGCCAFTNGSSFQDNGPNTYPVTTCTEGQDGGGSRCSD